MLETRLWQRINFSYIFIISALIIGILFPDLTALALISISIFTAWSSYQLQKLDGWLKASQKGEPPESKGIWGLIFDKIFYLQKQERKAKRELKNIILRARQSANSLNDGVITIKNDGTLEWWNCAANHLTGFKYPEDVGQQLTHLWRAPSLKNYFKSKDYQQPLIIPSPHMNNVQLQVQISLFGKDDRLMIIRDITRLQHLEQMRTEFVANVSHELRTPLTVISGYVENFCEQLEQFPPAIQRGLTQIYDQSKRMDALVNDLLLLSKLETSDQKDDNKPLSINGLLKKIRHEAQALGNHKGHTVTLDLPKEKEISLQGNFNEIRSAISNLTTNAVKYTPQNGLIHIQAILKTDGLTISVSDNGNGIDPKHIPRLTERFYRADTSRTQKTGGTGLGLAIVKHVLMRHDGFLEINSQLGKGSRFLCQLPAERVSFEMKQSKKEKPLETT